MPASLLNNKASGEGSGSSDFILLVIGFIGFIKVCIVGWGGLGNPGGNLFICPCAATADIGWLADSNNLPRWFGEEREVAIAGGRFPGRTPGKDC